MAGQVSRGFRSIGTGTAEGIGRLGYAEAYAEAYAEGIRGAAGWVVGVGGCLFFNNYILVLILNKNQRFKYNKQ